jgi:hypothetical protein
MPCQNGNFLSAQFSKNLLGSAPLRYPCGRLNHQKHRAVSTRARIRSRVRCGGKVRIRHLLDRDLADRLLIVPLTGERPSGSHPWNRFLLHDPSW